MSGHVFITCGDLTKLSCDAWLLPADAGCFVTHHWWEGVSDDLRRQLAGLRYGDTPRPDNWGDRGARVIPLLGLQTELDQPCPYLVNVGGGLGSPIDWFMEGARQFFQVVAEQHRGEGHHRRPRPLVALPLIGTGHGGAGHVKGEVVRALVDELYKAAEKYGFDVALVTDSVQPFVAAQNARWQHLGSLQGTATCDLWPELSDKLAASARTLARRASTGGLVLFIGSGVSADAGLPSWESLLNGLARDAGMDGREQDALAKLSILDRPRIIESRLAAKGRSIGKAVCDRLMEKCYSLMHSLLATLPISEVVTTNYDCLFEDASWAAGRATAVLPYQPVSGSSRWLLKMHGCVNHSEDIVLTREDYLRYPDRRAALAGIVQALLITRHMLFIGFSLIDDNFNRIVDEVRKAIGGTDHQTLDGKPFGTAILLQKDELLEELWRKDLNIVSMFDSAEVSIPEGARRLEIFLDYLLAEASRATSPLLDEAFEGILTDDERAVRDLLKSLMQGASKDLQRSPAWQPVAELIERLGGPSVQR
ncbi:MAG TPA: SIR2 family protein [Chloroflexota bacterium]|nr:SIR2 family protein [Chloroflexota bacterium]